MMKRGPFDIREATPDMTAPVGQRDGQLYTSGKPDKRAHRVGCLPGSISPVKATEDMTHPVGFREGELFCRPYSDTAEDTVTADVLLEGYTAHDADGEQIMGAYVPPDFSEVDVTANKMLLGTKALNADEELIIGEIETFDGHITVTENQTLLTNGKYVEGDININVQPQEVIRDIRYNHGGAIGFRTYTLLLGEPGATFADFLAHQYNFAGIFVEYNGEVYYETAAVSWPLRSYPGEQTIKTTDKIDDFDEYTLHQTIQ